MTNKIDIEQISINLLGIPSKDEAPVVFKRSMLHIPNPSTLRSNLKLSEIPYFTVSAKYPESVLIGLSYEEKLNFFFSKEKFEQILNSNLDSSSFNNLNSVDKLNDKTNLEIFKKEIQVNSVYYKQAEAELNLEKAKEKQTNAIELKKITIDAAEAAIATAGASSAAAVATYPAASAITPYINATNVFMNLIKINADDADIAAAASVAKRARDDIPAYSTNSSTLPDIYTDLDAVEKPVADVIDAAKNVINANAKVTEAQTIISATGATSNQTSDQYKETQNKRKKEIIDYNINLMITLLFPTSFPSINNYSNSFQKYIKKERSGFVINLPRAIKNIIPSGGLTDDSTGQYTYLKIDSKIVTVTKIIWLNDFMNHPVYKDFIDFYIKFKDWRNKKKDDIQKKLEEEKEKFKEEFGKQTTLNNLNKMNTELRKFFDSNINYYNSYNNGSRFTFVKEYIDMIQRIFGFTEGIEPDGRRSTVTFIFTDFTLTPPNLSDDFIENAIEQTDDLRNIINKNNTGVSIPSILQNMFNKLLNSAKRFHNLNLINEKYFMSDININVDDDSKDLKDDFNEKSYKEYFDYIQKLKEIVSPNRETTNSQLQQLIQDYKQNNSNVFNSYLTFIYTNYIRGNNINIDGFDELLKIYFTIKHIFILELNKVNKQIAAAEAEAEATLRVAAAPVTSATLSTSAAAGAKVISAVVELTNKINEIEKDIDKNNKKIEEKNKNLEFAKEGKNVDGSPFNRGYNKKTSITKYTNEKKNLEDSNNLLNDEIEIIKKQIENEKKYDTTSNLFINLCKQQTIMNKFNSVIENPKWTEDDIKDTFYVGIGYNETVDTNGAKYNLFLQLNLVGGILNNENKSKIKCNYTGEILGEEYEKFRNSHNFKHWKVNNNNKIIFDIDEDQKKMEEIEKKNKEEQKKVLELSKPQIQQPVVIPTGGNSGRKTYKRTKRSRKYKINQRKTRKQCK